MRRVAVLQGRFGSVSAPLFKVSASDAYSKAPILVDRHEFFHSRPTPPHRLLAWLFVAEVWWRVAQGRALQR